MKNVGFRFAVSQVQELPTDQLTETPFHVAYRLFFKERSFVGATFDELLSMPAGIAKATSPGYFVRCSAEVSNPLHEKHPRRAALGTL